MHMNGSTPEWRQNYDAMSVPPTRGGMGRRSFLQGMLAAGALGASGLQWLGSAPDAAALEAGERILVLVMLGGGNDGFSMLAPAEDGRYHDARRDLAITPDEGLVADEGLYWNPNLAGIAARYDAGKVAVVQGVGDPADDLSHFSSLARQMGGLVDGGPPDPTGWLGRWLDGLGSQDFAGITIGDVGVPLHMRGYASKVTSLPSEGKLYGADVKRWEEPAIEAARSIAKAGPAGRWPAAVANTLADAIGAASAIAPLYGDEKPAEGIRRDLALAADAINLDIGARVLSVSFGNFDTHADHRAHHDRLLRDFDAAVAEFFSRLNPAIADQVSIMTVSEFGRSWTANDSAGVDHGTASNALVIGNAVQGGLYGEQPNFSRFDTNGDLYATVDFRSTYATVLDEWLDADSQQILGARYEKLGVFSTGPRTPKIGDVNCDDKVTMTDALIMARHADEPRTDSGGCPLTDPAAQIHLAAGDVNGDGAVTLVDAMMTTQCSTGLNNSFCPEV